MPRVYRAAVEISIDRNTVFRGQFLRDFSPHGIEEDRLRLQIFGPAILIDLFDAQFLWNIFMPRLERLTPLGVVYPDDKQHYDGDG